MIPIQGYENLYSICEDGRVYSHKRSRYLKPSLKGHTHLKIGLCKDGKHKFFYVHRLVAKHFINNDRPDTDMVDHIDRNVLNNHVSNLRWVTRSENIHNQDSVGYSWDKDCQKWRARIKFGNKLINLGSFDNKDDASKAYCDASRKYYPGIRNDLI